MNTIFKLNEKLENLPSILSIEDELFFIDRLQTLPIDEIRKNKEIFKRIISAIQESHQDNGIFEITDTNINIIFEFVIWIRNLKKLYHLDFEKYIDGLDTNFDGSQQIWSSNEKNIQQAVMCKTRGENKGFTLRELNSPGRKFVCINTGVDTER